MKRACIIASLGCALSAHAASGTLRAEPSATFAVSEPQSTYFTAGGGLNLAAQLDVADWLGAFVQLGGLALPARSGAPVLGPASAFFAGLGLRAQRPRAGTLLVPWVDVSFLYVNTGGLSRIAVHGGVGVGFHLFDRFSIGPHLRFMHVFKLVEEEGYRSADAELLELGLTLELDLVQPPQPPADTDGDGLVDERDACPTQFAKTPDGCPDRDTDGDTVVDRADECPRVAGLPRLAGCPDPDPDRDGILGEKDACPQIAEDFDGFEDEDGCLDADNDKDGLIDEQDACPLFPGPLATQGCPDTDGDETADRVDQCINTPGPKENGGCPIYKQVVVTEVKIEIKQKIFFAFGKADILPKSFGLMNEVVQAMKDHDKLCVRIEGHTDAKGSRKVNLKLSDDRARSVREYLVKRDVATGRMSSIGYGPDQPLDDNKTSDGREKNRRVEFVIVPCVEGSR